MADLPRTSLPIPDRKHVGDLVTFDAKDPGDLVPADRDVAASGGRAERAHRAPRRHRLRCIERVRRAVPDAERRAAGGERPEVLALPHHRAVLADASRAPVRPQPPHRRHGRHHRDRHLGAGIQLVAAEHLRAARRDVAAERLLDRAVRQVPRGAGVGDEPDGAVRPLAPSRRRLRVLLRLHRRRDEPVLPRALRRHRADRDTEVPRGGVSPHRRHDRQGDHVGATAEGAHARPSVLRVLRAGRDARSPPRRTGVVSEVQGQVRPRLGQAARGDVRSPEGARCHPGRRRAHGRATTRSPPGTTCPTS